MSGEAKRRNVKIRNNPELLKKAREANKRWKMENEEAYRESKRKSDKKYYENNKAALLEYRKNRLELKRFGVSRKEVFKYHGEYCGICETDKDLVVHHIDGKGRGYKKPNNHLDNFMVMCRSCHMKHHLHN
jgi:gamma-glutamylcysteine synthetase